MNEFNKEVTRIAIPVALQCMLQSSFSIVDQLMIGSLGVESVAAVGVCGNFWLIFNVVTGVLGTVAGIMISQFIGSNDELETWRSFNVNTVVMVLIAAFFMLITFKSPMMIMGLYNTDPLVIAAGADYIAIAAWGFIPLGIHMMLGTYLRCKEHANIPLVASFVSAIINTGLNYILIYGKLGMPKMGVKGAALATLLSLIIGLLILIVGFIYCLLKDNTKPVLSFKLTKIKPSQYALMIAPLLVSEFSWGLSQNIYSATYGHMSTASLAAYSVTTHIQGLVCGILSGFSAAAGIMVGKRLGAENFDDAYDASRKIIIFGLLGSVLFAVILFIASPWYVSLYSFDADVSNIARLLLGMFGLYTPAKVGNMVLGGGILKSGGNTSITMIIDMIGTWIFGIPLCYISANILHLDIVLVYAILSSEEVIRLLISYVLFKKKIWMKSFA